MTGEGPPLVLLHGWCCDRTWWQHSGYVADLQRDYRLLNIDQRGHGASDKPAEPAAYARDRVVGDVLAVLEAEGVDRFAVWGLSYGGWVGFMAAEDHPARVTALVTTGAWDCQPEVIDPDQPYEDSWADAIREGGMPGLIAVFKEETGDSYDTEFPPWAEATTLNADPAALLAVNDPSLAAEGVTTLDTFPTPTLLIAGRLEDPHDEASAVAARMPHGQSLRLPGVAHGGGCSSPSALPVAREFLPRSSA